ncbi:MAG TPA: phosphatase PAP2 family protein [Thermodesulfovibrionales bacterium]|nr:phosphatase PAP2 family protein [Thermodesulfovibrionales bacterium]
MKRLFLMRPADSVTVLFLAFLLAVSLIFSRALPHAYGLILTYSLLLIVQIMLVRSPAPAGGNGVTGFVRNLIFPVVSVLIIFNSLEMLVHDLHPRDIDQALIKLDYLIFNGYPTIILEALQRPLLTDVLQVAYSTYYFLPISLGLLLMLRKRDGEFERTLFLILLCFYLSYIGYMLFPALGPRYTMDHLQGSELRGAFAAEPIQRVLNGLEGIKRDAFPSGHTAVSLVVSFLAFKYHRIFFYLTLPVIALLIFSTVYCRYHYVVDVLGGFILAALTCMMGERYYDYWEVRNDISR